MIQKSRTRFVLVVLIPMLMLSACLSTDFLPPQGGVYGIIGTIKFLLDDPRGLVIQAWYPAANIGDGVLDPLIAKEQALAFVSFLPIGKEHFENRLPSNSFVDAPIMPSTPPYPIIIFDHGFEGYEKQNMTQMEELASHGYVVFSINHPGESSVTVYPDGRVVGIDHDLYPSLAAESKKQREVNVELALAFIESVRNAENEKIEVVRVFSSTPRITNMKRPIKERTEDVFFADDFRGDGLLRYLMENSLSFGIMLFIFELKTMSMKKSRVVIVFGTFDGLHPGHIDFLRQAGTYGNKVVASVARDAFVRRFKGKAPHFTQAQRLNALLESGLVAEAFLGDPLQGSYDLLSRVDPEVICLGYDQHELAADLKAWLNKQKLTLPVKRLKPYHSGIYKSSQLRPGRPGLTKSAR